VIDFGGFEREEEQVEPAKTMMALLDGTGAEVLRGPDVAVTSLAYRSSVVTPGAAFFCIAGFAADGHDYAADAVSRGASALVVERELPLDVPQFRCDDTRIALALASSAFFDRPSAEFDLVGITGTNGKTTTTYLLDAIFAAQGRSTGLVGTVETRVAGERESAGRTTPESLDLQALFARMRAAGVSGASMEVSSHALDLHRVDGTVFSAVAFTNLTQDHLDYHHTLEEYFSVKKRLFTSFGPAARVVNIDDPAGEALACEVCAEFTVGRSAEATVRACDERMDAHGTDFTLVTPEGCAAVRLPLAGAYNINNALVAAGCALACGVPLDVIVRGLQAAPQVPGRLERVMCGQDFSVVVDYAHTPDSVDKAIAAVRAVTEGKVIAVFGCGGDRDPDKRPLMGAAAAASDLAIITSDNPRSEDPVGIILQIEDGIRPTGTPYEVEVDRRRAIERAISLAGPGDCVLIAGKGHEDYQIFSDRTVHFDDREVVREVLASC
jgi:UDP-N-acetylmuramoyl-L-alanyl-D-glutamate--2,6-diaminopimelate ligase